MRCLTMMMTVLLIVWPPHAGAAERLVRLHAPEGIVATGLLRHVVPRFSLKTQIRVELVAEAPAAEVLIGDTGQAAFRTADGDGGADALDGGQLWRVRTTATGNAHAERLVAWLLGEIGQRTILSYAPDGVPLFAAAAQETRAAAALPVAGDAARGHDVSVRKCGRCHAANEAGRMKDIGSTPSFFVLRALPDWQDRFSAFYALNPHPAFTQVADVTEPFAIDRPSPIVPIEVTLDEVQSILAYVATLKAANLGAPLAHQ